MAILAALVIGLCIGVLAQDSYDIVFRVEQWLKRLRG